MLIQVQTVALLSLVLAAISGCAASINAVNALDFKRFPAENREEMIRAVSARIPVGTPLREAREIMVEAGFECQAIASGSFSEDPGYLGEDSNDYREVENTRFLHCRMMEPDGFLVSDIWNVAIVLDESDQVVDVLALHRMEGP